VFVQALDYCSQGKVFLAEMTVVGVRQFIMHPTVKGFTFKCCSCLKAGLADDSDNLLLVSDPRLCQARSLAIFAITSATFMRTEDAGDE
jgi:hypothetical protein